MQSKHNVRKSLGKLQPALSDSEMRERSHPWDRLSVDFIMGLMAKGWISCASYPGLPCLCLRSAEIGKVYPSAA